MSVKTNNLGTNKPSFLTIIKETFLVATMELSEKSVMQIVTHQFSRDRNYKTLTEVFEDDDDVFITVDHRLAKNTEPDLPADEYAKSTKIKYVYRVWHNNRECLILLNETT